MQELFPILEAGCRGIEGERNTPGVASANEDVASIEVPAQQRNNPAGSGTRWGLNGGAKEEFTGEGGKCSGAPGMIGVDQSEHGIRGARERIGRGPCWRRNAIREKPAKGKEIY